MPPKLMPTERKPLIRFYLFYMDDVPLFATEATDPPEVVLRQMSDGILFPKGHTFDVRDAVAVPLADLERLRLMMELKGALFNFSQVALEARARASGLAIATPGETFPRQ